MVQRSRGHNSIGVCDYDIQGLSKIGPDPVTTHACYRIRLYLFGLVGTGAALLQCFNIAVLNTFWPFFTGIVVHLLAAMFQFARIILLPPEA